MMMERATTTRSPQYVLGDLIMSHSGPWTLEEFESIPPEVSVELHEGKLILTPSATFGHMRASRRLADHFDDLVDDPDVVGMEVDVYCGRNRSCVRKPDVLVLADPEEGRPIAPDNLLLVAEVVSPGSKDEWGDKMTDYADAGIPWYLIVQDTKDGYRAELHHLADSGEYELVEDVNPADVLRLPEPFDGSIDLRTLAPRKR